MRLAGDSLSASTGERAGVRCRVLVPLRGPELPADLEGDHGLAGAGGHGDQDTTPNSNDGLNDQVDGNALVVVRDLAGGEVKGREKAVGGSRVVELLALAVAGPEVIPGWELGELVFVTGEEIELNDAGAVGGVGEGEAQDGSVLLGLLEAIGRVFVISFGLDHREREIPGVAEQIIGAFPWATAGGLAMGDNAAVREVTLLGDGVWIVIPAGLLEERHDELAACVSLGHGHDSGGAGATGVCAASDRGG